jgi:hypothetical protein
MNNDWLGRWVNYDGDMVWWMIMYWCRVKYWWEGMNYRRMRVHKWRMRAHKWRVRMHEW